MNMYLMIISSNDNDAIEDIVVNIMIVKATVSARKNYIFVNDIFFK